MKIEIDADVAEQVTHSQLEHSLKDLGLSYKQRKKNNKVMFFHDDRKKDLAEMKRYMDAFKLIISYYKVPV